MRSSFASALVLCVFMLQPDQPGLAAEPAAAPKEQKPTVNDLNTPRQFPSIVSREQWEERAKEIRHNILVSCGLWPKPEKTPLQARIFGRIDRDGYSVEKVHFQPLPGFYLAGNLYRPLGRGKGPFPAILNPHGHWREGRLVDSKDGSVAARCISFARQGMIAFSYDMVGYQDTFFPEQGNVPVAQFPNRHRHFATNRVDLLWNISLMGLQTWNSIRALDFLESLPDVDRKRLACTGASGGGTQTFMLGAVDDRLAAQAPVVMVSHSMQGGCLCENAPGLRVDYSNMEIAAVPAPRPQILVAATGDWTRMTLTVEGPAIEQVYGLFNAADRLRYVRFDFNHNYNQTSREAVYDWFGRWLLKHPDPASLTEGPYAKEPDTDLRVFPDGRLPENAKTQAQIVESLKLQHLAQWESLVVRNEAGWERFRQFMRPAWRRTLQLDWPASTVRSRAEKVGPAGEFTAARLKISRSENSPPIVCSYWSPPGNGDKPAPKVAVLCSDKSVAPAPDAELKPTGLALSLLQRGLAVLTVDQFSTGDPPDPFTNYYSTYNRTKLQERVRDLLTVCAAGGSVTEPNSPRFSEVILVGTGSAGLWAVLAAPAAAAVIADCNQLDVTRDETLLAPDLFCPGLRNIGTFEGSAMLAAPHPLLLHNTGTAFPTTALRSTYRATGASDKLRVVAARLADDELVRWALGSGQ